MKRHSSIFLLVLLGILTAFFAYRLQVGAFLLTKVFELTGGENIQIVLAELSSRRIVFSSAAWTLPKNAGQFSLQDTILTWSSTTLKKRQLDTISIGTLRVALPEKGQTSSKKKNTVELVTRQLDRIQEALPFKNLFINHLLLTGPSTGLLAGKEISLKILNQDSGITSVISINDLNLQLDLNSPQKKQWHLTLNKTGQMVPFFSAQMHLQKNLLQAEIETDLARTGPLNTVLNTPLPKLKGNLSGTLSLSLQQEIMADIVMNLQQVAFAGMTADSIKFALHGKVQSAGTFQLENGSGLTISNMKKKTLSITDLIIDLSGVLKKTTDHWEYSSGHSEKTMVRGLKGSSLKIDAIEIIPAMIGRYSRKTITLTLQPEWQMRVSGVQAGGVDITETSLQPKQQTEISASFNKNLLWSIAPSSWQWTTNTVKIQGTSIEPTPIYITIQQLEGGVQNRRLQADLTCQRLGLTKKGVELSLIDVTTFFNIDTDRVTGTAYFSPETVPGILVIRFSHDLKNNRADATIDSKEDLLFSEITPLSSILKNWPLAGDLTSGRLHVKGSVSRQQKHPLQASLQVHLSEGKGNFKEILFSGLTINQDLQLLPTMQSQNDGSIAIDTIETGITVKDIAMKTAFTRSPHGKLPVIIIRNLSASLFGGTASDDFFTYDPQQPEVRSTLHLNKIDLAQLITVQQIKGLEVKGQIEGNLPFFFDRTGLRINEGTLQNTTGGGLIRYTLAGNNGLKESPLTGYALKALEEFHYSLLSAKTEYRPDGELRVSLHLEGKSPKLETNRPVHLNINTEQNLLSLLKSLRYSKSLTDEIDKEVQEQYKY